MPTIQNRRANAAQWTAANPVLAAGEIGFELDTNAIKIGDGLTPWATLPYLTDETIPTIAGRYAGPDLAPVYISTIETGLCPDTPTNIRAGLSTTTASGGGYAQEMTIAVSGTAGSAVLNSTESAKVAGLGSGKFEAVLNATDGTNDFFVTVLSHNGSNQLTLRAPLARNFTGTLSSKYDANLGQHLTKAATLAYAQHASTYSGALGAKGRILAGVWEHRPAAYYTDVWKLNAALTAYGVSNTADSPIVRSEMTVGGVHNILLAADRMPMYPAYKATGPNVGTHLKGHGAEATIYTGRRNAVLEFFTSANRSTAAGHRLRVTVTGDGAALYDQTHDGWLTRVNVPVNGFDRVVVSVTNDQDNPVALRLSSLILREAGTSGRVGQGRVVTLGDSWFGYYDGEFAKALAAKTGAQVVNHGLGGTTTEWALDWFDHYVLAEKPDECWIHFFTNDLNNNQTGATYLAPDGTTKPLWPTGLTSDQARDRWIRNLATLIYRCQKAGIRPVIIKPGGTASENQMQRNVVASSEMEKPAVADWNALPAEVADVAAYINVVGKRTGAQITVAGQPRYASGPNPADVWSAPTTV